jgi:hypothetical protein
VHWSSAVLALVQNIVTEPWDVRVGSSASISCSKIPRHQYAAAYRQLDFRLLRWFTI